MAKIGMFGRHTEESGTPTAVGAATARDRDSDGVDDRTEPRPTHATEERLVTRDRDTAVYDARKDAPSKGDAEAAAAHERTQTRLANRERLAAKEREADRVEAPTVTAPAAEVEDRVPPPKIRARSSLVATLALIVGVTAVYAALTGLLAPVAVVLGALGLLFSITGLFAAGRRPRVAGSGLAFFALLLSVGGAVLGVLAMFDTASWLDSDVDQVARWRDWLETAMPFMRDW